jgi:hypothetical protein
MTGRAVFSTARDPGTCAASEFGSDLSWPRSGGLGRFACWYAIANRRHRPLDGVVSLSAAVRANRGSQILARKAVGNWVAAT